MTNQSMTQRPSWWTGMLRGLGRHCPQCATGKAFRSYLKIVDRCEHCDAQLGTTRADDAPPYFTICIVGHIVVPLMLLVERFYAPSSWVHAALWVPLTILLTVAMLPYVKGGVLGMMWGFGIRGDESCERQDGTPS